MSVDAVELFLKLSRDSLELTRQYFNIEQPLYFDFTHLACRTALNGRSMGLDLQCIQWSLQFKSSFSSKLRQISDAKDVQASVLPF